MANSIRKRWNFGFPVIGVYSNSQAGLRRHQFQTYPPDHFQKSNWKAQSELLDKAAYVGLHQQSFYVVNAYKQLSTIEHCENDPDEINGLYDLIGWHPVKDQNDVPLVTDGDDGHCQIGEFSKT